MSYNYANDHTYSLYGGVAISYKKVPHPFYMPAPHFHQDYELFILMEGGRKFFLSNTIFSLESHSTLLVEPNEPHQTTINLNSPLERYVVYISPKLMETIFRENPKLRKFLEIQCSKLSDNAFCELIEFVEHIKAQLALQDNYSEYHLKNIVTNIIILLLREFENNEPVPTPFEKNDIRIQAPINYILNHYQEPITLKDCADIAYMSPSHFSRQFHLITGMNFKEYLNKVRVDKACELLKSDKNYSVTELTLKVGFTNSSYFTSIFRQITGLTPTEYKKAYSKK